MCEEKPKFHVVSFSGGKDSTAMLCGMKDRGMKIDLILYCDTGLEFPAMYEHINRVERYVGIPITRLKAEKPFEYWLLEHEVQRKNPELRGLKGYSWAGCRNRWCTKELKTNVIYRYLSNLNKKFTVIHYIGIATDEQERVRDKKYPLVDWGMTEADCLKYCYDKGFNFGGLYNIFHRVSCWCCPLQSLEELRQLRKHFPDLWQQLQEWQLKTWRKFRADFSVQELEIRFQLEEERAKKGLSISGHNKEFRAELKRRLNNKQRKDEVNMTFADKLNKLKSELGLSQAQICELTGIGKSSISQYLSGKNEPSKDRKEKIARALGVQETYFEMFEPAATVQHDGVVNLPVTLAAKLLKKSKEWVMQGLRDGVFPWGYAVKLTKWSYFISSKKFTEYTGIEVPMNEVA